MKQLTILPSGDKGRSFHATMLAHVEADDLWPGGQTVTDNIRPVWAMIGGSENELRAFMANITTGRKAELPGKGYNRKKEYLEILKSSGYRMLWQREEEGSVATLYLPSLFLLDPGMVDPSGIRFVLLPTAEWYNSQKDYPELIRHVRAVLDLKPSADKRPTEEQLQYLAPLSFLFISYLDRRTRCPIPPDPRFFFQLLIACAQEELVSLNSEGVYSNDRGFGLAIHKYKEYNVTGVGMLPGLSFSASHETFERVLSTEVARYYEVTKGA